MLKKGIALAIILLFIGTIIIPISGIGVFFDDTTPPVTTCTLDPDVPDGDNGWYVSNVTVTLKATDDMSGVNATYYRINGGKWEIYDSPFVIWEDGEHMIGYYSVDYEGNIEDIQSSSLDIDQTPPEISFEWDIFEDGGFYYLTITIICLNETSGMDRVDMFINDGLHATITGAGPTYEFTIEWSSAIKSCTFKFGIYDEAGNMAILKMESIKVLLFGRIENLTTVGDFFIFNAVRLRFIQFSPFSFNTYTSGEKVAVFEPKLKIVTNSFMFGFFIMLHFYIQSDSFN
jgi:hypothetical protein